MRRMMVLLCTTATLSGPLLRQAESAGDHARAVATLADPEGSIFTPDGGVGDDSGEMTSNRGAGLESDPDWAPHWDWDQPSDIGSFPPTFTSISTKHFRRRDQSRRARAGWLPIGASQRHSWLQLLLI